MQKYCEKYCCCKKIKNKCSFWRFWGKAVRPRSGKQCNSVSRNTFQWLTRQMHVYLSSFTVSIKSITSFSCLFIFQQVQSYISQLHKNGFIFVCKHILHTHRCLERKKKLITSSKLPSLKSTTSKGIIWTQTSFNAPYLAYLKKHHRFTCVKKETNVVKLQGVIFQKS